MGYPPFNKKTKRPHISDGTHLLFQCCMKRKSSAILAIGTKHRQEAKYHRNNINYRVD